MWLSMTGYFKIVKDIPMGPVPLGELDPAKARANDERSVNQQNKVFAALKRGMLIACAMIAVGIVIIIIS